MLGKNLFLSSYVVLFSSQAFANDFCVRLGQKLEETQNYSGSIVQQLKYNYTASGFPNFLQPTEYQFQVERFSISNQIEEENLYVDEEDLFKNHFNKQKQNVHSQSEKVTLKNCIQDSSNTARFQITRAFPSTRSKQQPMFQIDFEKTESGWALLNASSLNCNSILYDHFLTIYKDFNQANNRHTSERFYQTDLKDMVSQEVCPAHIYSLNSFFTAIVFQL